MTATGGCESGPGTLNDGLLLHFPFDAAFAGTVTDTSGNGHDGMVSGAVQDASGWIGSAVRLDGTNDAIVVNGIVLSNRSYSLAVWAKPTAVFQPCCNPGRSTIIAQGTASHAKGLQFGYDWNGKFMFHEYNEDLYTANTYADEGQWHHWVATYDTTSKVQRLYRDGVEVANRVAATNYAGNGQLLIGHGFGIFGVSWYGGLLDDVRVYERQLASNEVATLYAGTGSGPVPVLLTATTSAVCPKVITRVWTATDACGTSVAATQKITLVDTIAPVIEGVPTSLTVNCGTVPSLALVTATDNCDPAPVVTLSVVTNGTCPGSITRTWSAADSCGNFTSGVQTITFVPEPPMLVGVPADATVDCHSVPSAPIVTAISGCHGGPGSVDDGLLLHFPFDASFSGTVADTSGNGHDGAVSGAVRDPAGLSGGAAYLDGTNDVITVDGIALSNRSYSLAVWAKPTAASQLCCNEGRGTIIAQGSASHAKGLQFGYEWTGQFFFHEYNEDLYTPTSYPDEGQWHLWVATYETTSKVQRIYRDGLEVAKRVAGGNYLGTGPLLIGHGFGIFGVSWYGGLLDDLRVYGRSLASNDVAALYAEAGGVAVPVLLTATTSGVCPKVITRVWTATDHCGGTVTATQKMTVADTTAPVLVDVPGDQVVPCEDVPAPASVAATDNCDPAPVVTFSATTNGACPGTITRIWTAIDTCGNSVSATQTITVESSEIDGGGLVRQERLLRDRGRRAPPSDNLDQPTLRRIVLDDFDGDLRSDLGFYRASDGFWIIQGSAREIPSLQLGSGRMRPVPGDYDGDGLTDYGVYDGNSGLWYLLESVAGVRVSQFGYNGTDPVQADYDGDGKTDLAVYDSTVNQWHMALTTLGYRVLTFGQAGALPVPADYDGDGLADPACYIGGETGSWYVLSASKTNVTLFGYGDSTPMPADYDGDGRADVAVFSKSSSTWSIQRSRMGFTSFTFDFKDAVPVAGDFDGDGSYDPAVYDSGGNAWHLSQSSEGYLKVLFSVTNGLPLGSPP